MPRSARLINALAAMCAVLLVAAVLAAFGRTAPPGGKVRAGAPTGLRPRPSSPTATTAAQATTEAPTTAEPTTTTTSTTSTTVAARPAATAATTAPLPPALDAAHRVPVATLSYTFVDPSRPTPPAPGDQGEATRTLPTIVRLPAAVHPGVPGGRTGAPFPLIVFAHGYDSSPSVYATLLDFWAGAGYVVAAPAFPRATAGGPLDENDLDNQPGDLSFVITKMLALAAPGGTLAGLVDPVRVGVAGHSDGASTTEGIGYNSCCRDKRVLADAVMEGDEHPFAKGALSVSGSAPLLVLQADQDAFNPAPLGLQLYHDARSPKYLLMLVNAQHLEPYTTDLAHLGVVEAVTTSFFDRYLKGRADGAAGMQRGAIHSLATLTSG